MITYWMSYVAPPFRPGNIDPDSVGPGGGGGLGTTGFLVLAGIVILVVWMTKKDSKAQAQRDLESQRFYQDLEKEQIEEERIRKAEREASSKDSDETSS